MTLWVAGFRQFFTDLITPDENRQEENIDTEPVKIKADAATLKSCLLSFSRLAFLYKRGFLVTNCGNLMDIKDATLVDENFLLLTNSAKLEVTENLDVKNRHSSLQVKTLNTERDSSIMSVNNTETCLIVQHENALSEMQISHDEEWYKQQSILLRALRLGDNVQVDRVSCGKEHTLILTKMGQVYSFGGGSRGQLGHSNVENQTDPKLVEELVGVTMISVAAGGWHSIAISALGDLYVWGWNESGQLGLPSKHKGRRPHGPSMTHSTSLMDSSPTAGIGSKYAEGNTDTAETASQNSETRKEIGDYYSSSSDYVDEKLDPLETQLFYQDVDQIQVQSTPCALDLGEYIRVKKVACGSRHTVVLTENHMVLSCGWNDYGQLCHGDTETRDYLQTVNYFIKKNLIVTDIYCGGWTTIFVTDDKGTIRRA